MRVCQMCIGRDGGWALVRRFIDLCRERLCECRAYAAKVLDGAGIDYSKDRGQSYLGPLVF